MMMGIGTPKSQSKIERPMANSPLSVGAGNHQYGLKFLLGIANVPEIDVA